MTDAFPKEAASELDRQTEQAELEDVSSDNRLAIKNLMGSSIQIEARYYQQKWPSLNPQEKYKAICHLTSLLKMQQIVRHDSVFYISQLMGIHQKDIKLFRKLGRLPGDIWFLVNTGQLCNSNLDSFLGFVDRLHPRQVEEFINLLIDYPKTKRYFSEGALKQEAIEKAFESARSDERKINAVRNKVSKKLKSDKLYVIDEDSKFANDYKGFDGEELVWIPFETEGYDEFHKRYGKPQEHILFCEKLKANRIHCVHYKAVKEVEDPFDQDDLND